MLLQSKITSIPLYVVNFELLKWKERALSELVISLLLTNWVIKSVSVIAVQKCFCLFCSQSEHSVVENTHEVFDLNIILM